MGALTFPTSGGGFNIDVELPSISGWLSKIANPNGELKVLLTEAYNEAERQLIQNKDAYLSGKASILRRSQALDFFDKVWSDLYRYSVSKGQQGMISWNDRQRTGKWCWECWYRDPIANDPRLSGVSSSAGDLLDKADDTISNLTGTSFGAIGTLAILAVLGFVIFRIVK